MTAQTKTTVKTYFETGDRPTQGQFGDLIDSYQDANSTLLTLASATVNNGGIALLATTSINAVGINGIIPTVSAGLVIRNSTSALVATFGNNGTSSNFASVVVSANATIGGNTSIAGTLAVTGAVSAASTGSFTGTLNILGNSTAAGVLKMYEDTDNGTNCITITPAQTLSDYTVNWPSAAGTIALTSDISEISATTATTSGTTVDIALSANIKQFTVNFEAVSVNGTAEIMIQLGTASAFETSGYNAIVSFITTAVGTATEGTGQTITSSIGATGNLYGSVTFTLENSSTNTWTASGSLGDTVLGATFVAAGGKSLSDVLTRMRLTTVGGTAAFDNGSINVVSFK